MHTLNQIAWDALYEYQKGELGYSDIVPDYSDVWFEESTYSVNDEPLLAGETYVEHRNLVKLGRYETDITKEDVRSCLAAIRGSGAMWVYSSPPEDAYEAEKRRLAEKLYIKGYDELLPSDLKKTGSWQYFWNNFKKTAAYAYDKEAIENQLMGYS